MTITYITVDPARLVRLREQKAWTRADLAVQTGISREAIAKIENGDRQPSAEALNELCAVLECTPASLLKEPEPTVERTGGGMRKWMFFTPYHSDVNGRRFLTRFVFFFTPYGGAHITRIHTADDQRKWPHDHSATFLSIRLAGGYEEDVYDDPGDLSSTRHRVHRWLSASRLRHTEAHSITAVKPFTVTLLLLGRRRQKSNYWTADGLAPLGMRMDDEDEW